MSSQHAVHSHHSVHAVVEIMNHGSDTAAGGLKVAKAVAASEAFRKYNWLKNVPIKNASGNFRGMVVSQRWATIFHLTEDIFKPLEKVAMVAALAENVTKASTAVNAIWHSSNSWDSKAAQLSTQMSSVALRTLGGAIPATAHVLALSLSGYCQLAGLAGVRGTTGLGERLKSLDSSITSTFAKVTDGENIRIFINTHLVIK